MKNIASSNFYDSLKGSITLSLFISALLTAGAQNHPVEYLNNGSTDYNTSIEMGFEIPQNNGYENDWKGKKVAILGDSMSDPRKKVTDKWFYDYLSESLGIIPMPYAKSGYTWKDLYELAHELEEIPYNDFDAIIIWAGTNDYNKSVPLGEFFSTESRTTNVNGKDAARVYRTINKDDATFTGRLNNLAEYLKTRYPDKPIVLLTPIHRGYARFGDKNVQPSEEFSNGEGLFIEDYVAAIRQAGQIWSIPVIDLFSESGIVPRLDSNSRYIVNPETDRLHPGTLGHQRIAKVVEKHLKTIPAGFTY